MRRTTLAGNPGVAPQQQIMWLISAVQELARASADENLVDIGKAYTVTGTFTDTRTLDVSTATLPDVIALLATLIGDLQRGGATRST